jgi:addiction module RelE/StbE family toxin
MQIKFSKKFEKQLVKQPQKIRTQFNNRLELWKRDRSNAQLRDHRLSGKYTGYRSINVNGDIRALYYEKGDVIIIFAFIGSHSQLYN